MLSVKNEIQQHFEDILVEHDYFETDVFCNDEQLKNRFNDFKLAVQSIKNK
jgi:hypothetical protein